MLRLPPRSPLFPYTPLFRSVSSLRLEAIRDGIQDANLFEAYRSRFGRARLVSLLASNGLFSARGGREEPVRSEEHTSELQSLRHLVCRLLLEKKNTTNTT